MTTVSVRGCCDCPFAAYTSPIDDQGESGGGYGCAAPLNLVRSKGPIFREADEPPPDCPLRGGALVVELVPAQPRFSYARALELAKEP